MASKEKRCTTCGKVFTDQSARYCDEDGTMLVEAKKSEKNLQRNQPGRLPQIILVCGLLLVCVSALFYFKESLFQLLFSPTDASKVRFKTTSAMLNKCFGDRIPDIPRPDETRSEAAFQKVKAFTKKISDKATSTVSVNLHEERSAGKTALELLRSSQQAATDSTQLVRLNPIVDKMSDLVPRGHELAYRLTLFGGDTVNAAMFPGGQLVVWEKLSQSLSLDQHLAFIIGHEIAHSELRHHEKILKFKKGGGDIVASVAGVFGQELGQHLGTIGGSVLASVYDQDEEFEADKLGLCIAHLAGFSQSGGHAGEAFASLESASHYTQKKASEQNPPSGAAFRVLYDILSTHPSTQLRQEFANSLSTQLKTL
jgi:Zn-dependent protease with chaperone function